MYKFTFIDLFAGLGGFHLAGKRIGGKCVFACEINKTLRDIYHKNFAILPHGDIRKIKPLDIPEHDILFAGFPCQPFSKAGDQRGWGYTLKGSDFWYITKILKHHNTPMFLLENVAHFVRHDSGQTYKKVCEYLSKHGYTIDYRQYSPHDFGIPQIRERTYMVGYKDSTRKFCWPEIDKNGFTLSIHNVLDKNPSEMKRINLHYIECLETWQSFLNLFPKSIEPPSFPIWSMEFKATYPYTYDSLSRVPIGILNKSKGCFGTSLTKMNRSDVYQNVPSYARGNINVFPKWKQDFIAQNREFYRQHKALIDPWLPKIRKFPPSLQKFEWNCKGGERNIWKYVIQFRASGVRIKRTNTSPSLVAMTTTQVPIVGWEKRYMTVKECARLQSMEELKHFPDGFAALKALGNAVNVTVVEKILSNLIMIK